MTNPDAPFVGGAVDLGALAARSARTGDAAAAGRGASPAAAPEPGAAPAAAAGAVAPYFEVTEENFETEVVRRSAQVPVVVVIGTPRSAASQALTEDLAALAQAASLSFIACYVNADAVPQIAAAFGVRNLPTTVALANGQPITSFEGGQPREALQQWTDMLVAKVGPTLSGLAPAATELSEDAPEDPRLQAAEAALAAGDFDAALAAYDEILAAEPDNTQIKQARGTTALLKRLNPAQREGDPIAQAQHSPDDLQAQLDGADAYIVAGDAEQAFELLISAISRWRSAEHSAQRASAKDRLLELFSLFDAADPRVLRARTALASALY